MSTETTEQPSPQFLHEFTASLPEAYVERYRNRGLDEHARLAAERRGEAASVALVSNLQSGVATVYFVADDRPGLLAMMTSALVECALEVVDGELYVRTTPASQREAIAIFEVVAEAQVLQGDLRLAIQSSLLGMLDGRMQSPSTLPTSRSPGPSETHVRFKEGSDGSLSVLEVETGDRSGLLHTLARALFEQRVQIVRSEVRTEAGKVLDKFHVVEFDGTPIDGARRLEIQVAVLSAVDMALS